MSLADVAIHGYLDFMKLTDCLEKFPKIAASFKKVEANKNIAKYLKERPPNEFSPV